MAAPVTVLTRRRVRNAAVVLAAVAALLAVTGLAETALRDTRFATGWLTLAMIAALMLFDLRKRIPVLPLGDAADWQQFHIYAGWFAVAVFAVHTEGGLPDGPLETALWALFVAVAVSGTIGLWLSRVLPRRMGAHGDRVQYDRIPVRRAALAEEAQALAIASAEDTLSITIADYYDKELRAFFHRPQTLLAHLTGYRGHLRRRLHQIESLNRYLDEGGRRTMARIADLVVAKDNLDYQLAAYDAIRFWLFVHVPLAHALLVIAVVHAVLSHAFVVGAS